MPRIKHSQELSKLVIADIRKGSGLAFKHPDRLSQAEVNAISRWAQHDKNVQAALADPSHPAHAGVVLYKNVLMHFMTDHPQSAAGEPEPWPDSQPTGRQPTADNPFLDLTAEQAEARLIFHATQPGYTNALRDPNHPDHALAVRETAAMNAVRHGAIDQPAPAAAPNAEALAAIRALDNDPAHQAAMRDPSHPARQAELDRRAQLYAAAYDGKAMPAPVAAGSPDAARARILEMRADPKFQARLHAQNPRLREEARAELAPLYDQAYPEPAADPAPEAA